MSRSEPNYTAAGRAARAILDETVDRVRALSRSRVVDAVCELDVRLTNAPCDLPATHVVVYRSSPDHRTYVCEAHLRDATRPVVHYPEDYTVQPV